MILVTSTVYLANKILPKFIKNKRILNLVAFLDRKLIWNGILRYTITAYLKLSKIALKNVRNFDDETGASICFKVAFLIFVCTFPM